jgi:hypothetical protein
MTSAFIQPEGQCLPFFNLTVETCPTVSSTVKKLFQGNIFLYLLGCPLLSRGQIWGEFKHGLITCFKLHTVTYSLAWCIWPQIPSFLRIILTPTQSPTAPPQNLVLSWSSKKFREWGKIGIFAPQTSASVHKFQPHELYSALFSSSDWFL